ncbi:hypothetical protein [Cohnella cholangitidis]|uniref:PIN domain-containing protein n=1 Tax=Cohnella cholangitidis TaxID=2598458 RepID=A0A7G5BWN4_9BACL|nr:hypothetical protein [Cohnella cholangitidis]QMV41368.1 hypothetical protein FPL14_09325 [Cohnella cholangitidis]
MWTFSSKRMLNAYGEKRLYVTDLDYDGKGHPNKIYIFLAEYGTEIEIAIAKIRLLKRSRESELYKAVQSDGQTFLLRTDLRRGNHFAYCLHDTYKHWIDVHLHGRSNNPSTDSLPVVSQSVPLLPIMQMKRKILLIDTEMIPKSYLHFKHWLRDNEIVLNPYYREWLDSRVGDPSLQADIHRELNSIAEHFPHKLVSDQYVDLESSRYHQRNLSDEREYLLTLAQQLQVTASQIVFLTQDEEWTLAIQAQGYQSVDLGAASPETSTSPRASDPIQETIGQQSLEQQTADRQTVLPPRSQRHKGLR